jgi:DNA-binding SARP family transcriptional activator
MTAVAVEPLRESAQRALVSAHLAEGNRIEALRCFDVYRALLWRELRVEPAADLTALLRSDPPGQRQWPWRAVAEV